ncbi:MAG: ParB/RepB/Spo0J family partition protein, partial [Enterococcus sp.]|nr:ParB/RepB/Spo0J family partition protein [Enterococcus sp.]
MAKKQGGLGKGLGTLISGSYKEAAKSDKKNPVVDGSDQVKQEERKPNYKEYGVSPWDSKGVRTRSVKPSKDYEETVVEVVEKEEKPKEQATPKKKESPVQKPEKKMSAKDLPKIQEKLGQMVVPLEDVEPNPDQPRTNFKAGEIEELAKSIQKDGLLQPILVRQMTDGKYQIIAGERRWQACKKAKLKEVPVTIKKANDAEAMELAMVENIHRS